MYGINFDGIGSLEKARIIKIFQAVQVGELVNLYASLQGTSENTRRDFLLCLAQNNLLGKTVAVEQLTRVVDPITAVRAAAVCLMMTRIKELGMNDV